MMRRMATPFCVLVLAWLGGLSLAVGDEPAEATPEAKALAAYQAAEAAVKEAEAALAPLQAEMQKTSDAYAQAANGANQKRRQANELERLAGEQGAKELQRAEAVLADAIKALNAAAEAKPKADQALADARAAALPLREAYEAAEKAAREAELAAKAAADAANKFEIEARIAAVRAAAQRKAADVAKTRLAQAQQALQEAQSRVNAATEKLTQVQAEKKAADEALANAKNQVTAATTAVQEAEKAAQEAAAKAKAVADDPNKSAEEKKQAGDEAAAKQKAIEDAKAALAQAQQNEQQAQGRVNAATQELAKAEAEKKSADEALANVQKEVATHQAVIDAAQKLSELEAAAVKAAQEAAAKRKAAAAGTDPAAQEAAKELLALDAAAAKAAEEAAAKRKAAEEAKAALEPKAKVVEDAAIQALEAARNLTAAEARKKSAEEALENLKKRIAAAKETYQAALEAAKQAEAVVPPLKEAADKARAAYLAARQVVDEKRALAQQAKAELYHVMAAKQIPAIMESPDPPKPANRIDEIVFAKLNALSIQPLLCSDAVFVRRVYLDIIGRIPTAEEVRAFLQDNNPNKRVALVDHLLDQPEHADYWSMKWGDILRIKAEFPVVLWPNGAQAYHRYVWESITQNKRYDQFVRELLTTSGSNFRDGPVNFYRAVQSKSPEGIAVVVALTLMGSRIDSWPEERRAGLASFFTQVGYKPTSEWKEEIVFWDPLKSVSVPGSIAPGVGTVPETVTATNQIPQGLAEPLSENGPREAILPDGSKVTIPPDRDPREVFAEWFIRPENPWFTKAIANRTWAWIMGRGIIHEADDIRDDNPPSNPELLAYLQQELVSSGYDLKHLKRLIFTSTTYQLSCIPRYKGPEGKANFASYPLRRLEAEVLADALNQITGGTDLYTSAVPEPFTYIPRGTRAITLADGSVTSAFLALFGRSARATGMESERVNEMSSPQWLHMLNSADMQRKLQSGPKLAATISAGGTPKEITERLYLTILSRLPTESEIKAAEDYAKSGVVKGPDVWIDMAWALINTPEFFLRH